MEVAAYKLEVHRTRCFCITFGGFYIIFTSKYYNAVVTISITFFFSTIFDAVIDDDEFVHIILSENMHVEVLLVSSGGWPNVI